MITDAGEPDVSSDSPIRLGRTRGPLSPSISLGTGTGADCSGPEVSPLLPTSGRTLHQRRAAPLRPMSMVAILDGSRETAAHSAEPAAAFRGWFTTALGQLVPTTAGRSFRAMTYNVLAQRYVSTDKYPDCPTWALAEGHRAAGIATEVRGCDPDVLALQELSTDNFVREGLLGSQLRGLGFVGEHIAVTDRRGEEVQSSLEQSLGRVTKGLSGVFEASPLAAISPPSASHSGSTSTPHLSTVGSTPLSTTTSSGHTLSACSVSDEPESSLSPHLPPRTRAAGVRGDVEGVALLYKPSRFRPLPQLGAVRLRLNEYPARDATLTDAERHRLTAASHNVAICQPLQCVHTGATFIFATIHAFWDASRPEGQVYQLERLLVAVHAVKQRVEALGVADSTVVLLGDFNAELSAPSLRYLRTGRLDLGESNVNPLSCWSRAANGAPAGPPIGGRVSQVSIAAGTGGQLLGPAGLHATIAGTPPGEAFRAVTVPATTARPWVSVAVKHPFTFSTAYAEYLCQHPDHVTAVNPSQGFTGVVIDHILVEKGKLAVLECARLRGRDTIPTPSVPSDHYPAAVTLIAASALDHRETEGADETTAAAVRAAFAMQQRSDACVAETDLKLSPKSGASFSNSPSWFTQA